MISIQSRKIVVIILLLAGCSIQRKEGNLLVQKAVEAVGGQFRLEKIQDFITEGKIEFYDSRGELSDRGSVTEYYKFPDQLRIEFDLNDSYFIDGYDGEMAWEQIDNQTVYEVDRERFIINLRLKQVPLSLLKTTFPWKVYQIEDERNYRLNVLEVTYPGPENVKLYFDETWLLRKYEGPSHSKPGSITSVVLSEYKSVEDVLVPFHITYYNDGVKFQERWIQKVRVNEGIRNDFFHNPLWDWFENSGRKMYFAGGSRDFDFFKIPIILQIEL